MRIIDWKRGTSEHIEYTVYIHVDNQIGTSNRSNSQISKFQLKETNHVDAKLPSGSSMFIKVSCTSEKSIY